MSSFLLIISFPKFDVEIVVWFSLVPIFLAVKDVSHRLYWFLFYLFGIVSYIGVSFWLNVLESFTPIDFLLLGIYLGFYFSLYGLMMSFISKRTQISSVFVAPPIWVSMEYLRSHAGFLALPWGLLGHSQYLNLPIIQIASVTGVYGISFMIVMVNAALSEVMWNLKERNTVSAIPKNLYKHVPVVMAFLFIGVSILYGYVTLAKPPGKDKVTVTVIQGNIPQGIKWDPAYRKYTIDKYARLTLDAHSSFEGKTSLIAWPESTIPGSLKSDMFFLQAIDNIVNKINTNLLIGSAQRPKMGSREFRRQNWFNSAFLFSPKGVIEEQYDKIHLLPFGEYLPYRDKFPWPERIASKADYFIPGNKHTIFNLDGAKFSVLICWESLFPELARESVKEGAQFLVNMSNEAWFGETAAPYQFLSMNVFRAVENRVYLIRSVNTGISCFIDASGEIIGAVRKGEKEIFVEGYLTKEISLSREKTFYTVYGDLFAYGNIILTICLFLMALRGQGDTFRFSMFRRSRRDR